MILFAAGLLQVSQSPIQIQIHPERVLRRFDPSVVFGGAVDGHEQGECLRMLSPASVALMKSAGLKPLCYRLRTELAGEAWHWNPAGSWSDPSHKQGYWTSSPIAGKPILLSYGYRLPRRGNSVDQASNNGYSRLDDGDSDTFWKSNPYLDPHYSHEPYSADPQWIVIRFKRPVSLNCMVIHWGEPFATKYEIDYWSGQGDQWDGSWVPVQRQQLGEDRRSQTIDFNPVRAKFMRILLLESSGVGPPGSNDPRDSMGFAVRELELGFKSSQGLFQDAIYHAKSRQAQTWMFVSSTDPWHREQDKDLSVEQPGFDLIARSGLGNGLPILMPVGALYDTPDNVAAEVSWLKARRSNLKGIEVGEEPDGQSCDASTYALLYAQMADAIRKVDPRVPIGGPSFQTASLDFCDFPRTGGSWFETVLKTLAAKGQRKNFQFLTFEWYPINNVFGNTTRQLEEAAPDLAASVNRLSENHAEGMPWMITEYGWSAYAAEPEVDLPGAILNLDLVLNALRLGGQTSYLYGYEPNEVIADEPGAWGNNMLFLESKNGAQPMPTFFGAQLLTRKACMQAGPHLLLAVDGAPASIGAYAIRRPDGRIATFLTNRSDTAKMVSVSGLPPGVLGGIRYDRSCYKWQSDGESGHPLVDRGPYAFAVSRDRILLPPFSITLLLQKD